MDNTTRKPEKILYIASTHWDREWYRSFQSFRFRLVKVMDEIIETLESSPEFSRFILDGQTAPLEDYLEIRPENRSRVQALIEQGRLIVGPWFTMPDESLCSGESLVNNLRLGFAAARGYGAEPMRLGYVCDIFGHVAQLPQILSGFGIDGAVVGRGTNRQETPAFFAWQSPDGSRALTFKLPEECGYGTFFHQVIRPYRTGKDASRERMLERAVRYVEFELARTALPYVLLMDGMDHERIHPEAIWLADELGKVFGCPVEFGTPADLLPQLRAHSGALPVMEGELRQTARAMAEHNKLIPHTLSSRYDVKRANDRCQTLLERAMGPLSALALLHGTPVPPGYARVAEKLMALNQAHDSICGCSIDEVSLDMLGRYRHVETIEREVREFALDAVFGLRDTVPLAPPPERMMLDMINNGTIDCKLRAEKADRLRLALFNLEPEDYKGAMEADIHFPAGYAASYPEYLPYEPHNMFRLFDADGAEVPYQLLEIEKDAYVDIQGSDYRARRDRYRVALRADIPAMGCREIAVQPSETPVRNAGSLREGALTAANEHIRLILSADGRVCIEDLATGRRYDDLLRFRDEGEIGDGWYHAQPVGDRAVLDGGSADVELLHDGSELCRFVVTKRLSVPSHMESNPHSTRRSAATVELCIRSELTLARGARWLDIRTTIHNNAKDHCLKLCVQTGIPSEEYMVDQAFAILPRKAGLPRHTHDWKEFDRGDHAFSQLVARRDASSGDGLAFLSEAGMHECMAHDDPQGTLDITLLRSFSRTFMTNGEPDGQLQGELNFHFALMPLSKADTNGRLARLRDRFANAPLSRTTIVPHGFEPSVRAHGFRLESEHVALSTLRPADMPGHLCVRLVNHAGQPESARLHCPASIKEAFASDMLEQKLNSASFEDGCLHVELTPFQIATFLLRFE